jgi:hypothetical protein
MVNDDTYLQKAQGRLGLGVFWLSLISLFTSLVVNALTIVEFFENLMH